MTGEESAKTNIDAAKLARKRKRRKMEEFEIDWIPEDTGAPYEAVEEDIPAHTIDKIRKRCSNWRLR